jgi:REP element-mobilizing transposase RayT
MYIQVVFAVQYRENLIAEENREEIEKYICGIISNKKCKVLAIYCNPDHVHILIALHPTISVSDLVRDIKANSSRFINEKGWLRGRFNWQDGFGAFTYAKSQIDGVVKYILRQPIHHQKQSFQDEYLSTLRRFEVEFDEKYLFDWVEN